MKSLRSSCGAKLFRKKFNQKLIGAARKSVCEIETKQRGTRTDRAKQGVSLKQRMVRENGQFRIECR